MRLTYPKPLDEPFVLIEKRPGEPPALHWTTPRSFMEEAAQYVRQEAIYAPPLMLDVRRADPQRDRAALSTAFACAFNLAKYVGVELDAFDSLYSAFRHIDSRAEADVDPGVRKVVEYYVQQALTLGREIVDEKGMKGLFSNFDYYVAANILQPRFDIDIDAVLEDIFPEKKGADKQVLIDAFERLCALRGWHAADFCNAVLACAGRLDAQPRPLSACDEYVAMVSIMEQLFARDGKTLVVSALERDVLGVRFDRARRSLWRPAHA